ncbi:uncharacterized protein LOC100200715 isoform X4 [Hydra vulgaris]|uniref:Uncharacterized protein LOC100200715 isoform X4 n=1 Tax=Hydra vulgaris TaxID=6087 RepID=A0ABM4D6Z3_HYDVU
MLFILVNLRIKKHKMQKSEDTIGYDKESEQLVPYDFHEETYEFTKHCFSKKHEEEPYEFSKYCLTKKRPYSIFNCDFDNKYKICFSSTESPPFKKRCYENGQCLPDFTWNSFEDLFAYLKYRVFSFAVNKCHMINMKNIEPEKKKDITKTNINTELFFELCTSSNNQQVNNINKYKTVADKNDCIINNEVIDTSTNETQFSLNKFKEQFSPEVDLFGCQIKMGLSTFVSPKSIYSPELCRMEDAVNKESVHTQEVNNQLKLLNSSKLFESHQLTSHFKSTNKQSSNNILKLKSWVCSPVKDEKDSPLLISNDFQIPDDIHNENLHVVPDENLALDQNDKPLETSESLYPNQNHFDYEKFSLLNDKKVSISSNSLLLSLQERPLPFNISERSVSKKTIDYIISDLMSTQGPSNMDLELQRPSIDSSFNNSVKRKISFDQLENSVVPNIEDIQIKCFSKGNILKKVKDSQEENLMERDCFPRPQEARITHISCEIIKKMENLPVVPGCQ